MTSRPRSSVLPGPTGIVLALGGTLALGLWLRWALAGQASIFGEFANLRHAHSHLGYFGVLFPLAWAAWGRAGAPTPDARVGWVYAAATALALVGFLRAGYGPAAMAGSTVVGAIWLVSARPLLARWRDLGDPLSVVPFGVAGALVCIPPIALNLRESPEVAQGFVATFLAILLFGVMVPSVMATVRGPSTPWPLLGVTAAAAALALGAVPHPVSRGGLILFCAILARFAARGEMPAHARATWGSVSLGLACVAVDLLPNIRPVAVGSIHFLILGPVLESLQPGTLRSWIPSWAWWLYHACVAALAVPLLLQGLGAGGRALTASAVGGSGVVLWWLAVGLALLLRRFRAHLLCASGHDRA